MTTCRPITKHSERNEEEINHVISHVHFCCFKQRCDAYANMVIPRSSKQNCLVAEIWILGMAAAKLNLKVTRRWTAYRVTRSVQPQNPHLGVGIIRIYCLVLEIWVLPVWRLL